MNPSLWTDEFLDKMRYKGDDEADAAVEFLYDKILDSKEAFRQVNALLYQLTFEGQLDIAKLPEPLKQYAERSARLPDWCDPGVVSEGQDLFYLNGFGATVLLLCASLPECYVMKNGVNVLGLTTYLTKRPKMRILETSQMVRDVMSPGQLVTGGSGVLAAQKVRLLHAAVRHLILRASGLDDDDDMGRHYAAIHWQPGWGHPICQEDMAYTLLTFSYVVVRGLRDLGVKMTDRQRDAYIHCWNITGHVMGIDRQLIPEPEDGDRMSRWELAEALYKRIRERQEGRTKPGAALAKALVDFMKEVIEEPIEKTVLLKRIGGRKLIYLPQFLMLHLLGKSTMDYLDVPVPKANGFERGFLRLLLHLTKRGEFYYQSGVKSGPFRRASLAFHQAITENLSKLPPDHKQQFLPEQLRRSAAATGQRPSEIVAGAAPGAARPAADRPSAEAPRAPQPGPDRSEGVDN